MTLHKSVFKKFALLMIITLLLTAVAQPISTSAATPSGFKYTSKIPMSKKQQQYLYNLSKKRGVNYYEMLAVIKIESSFKPKTYYYGCYGYFQISKGNHKGLAKATGTKVAPYDPYVNMNWGTYMLSNLTKKYKKKGYKGTKLRNAVLSSYNKGEYGYQKTGVAKSYVTKFEKALKQVKSYY